MAETNTAEKTMAQAKEQAEAESADLDTFSSEELHRLLREMLLYRRFEERAEEAYVIGKIGGFCHLHIGQEAAAAGCILPLREDDYVITAYRDHTQALAKGLSSREVMAELYGKKGGSSGGMGGSMHIFGAEKGFMGGHGIVGAQVPLATGMGWAIHYREEDKVCVCFLGDAAVNQGAFHESLNMAAIWDLPVVYIVENNEYGMGTAFSRVSETEIKERSCAYGIPGHYVYGQDVLRVYRMTEELVEKARSGGGPQFLEVRTYRFKGHSMSDPVSGTYRSKDEVSGKADEEDPIKVLRNKLFDADLLTEEELESMDQEVREEVDDAAEWADEQPSPDLDDLYTHVYSEINEHGRLFLDGRGEA